MTENNQVVSVTTQKRSNRSTAAAVGALALAPVLAFAEVPAAPDVTEALTYIGYAVVAIGAIGSAKMIPAAAMWLWSSLTGMAKRG